MRRIVLLSLALAACKTTGSPAPTDLHPNEPKVAPEPAAATQGPVVDQAAVDFQVEVRQIEAASAKGAYDWGDVKERMEGVIRKHPNYALAYYNLGVAHERLGEMEDAEASYKRAIERNPDLPQA